MRKLILMVVVATLSACDYGNGDNESTDTVSMKDSGAVIIMSPAEAAKVGANEPFFVQYEVSKSEQGDHVHAVVDNGKPEILRRLKGAYEVAGLASGQHTITIMEMTSSHSPTGNQASIQVTAE